MRGFEVGRGGVTLVFSEFNGWHEFQFCWIDAVFWQCLMVDSV
jgi:hypothetical protein